MTTPSSETLEDRLQDHTIATGAPLAIPVPDRSDWVQCLACGHRCRIPPGHPGICKVRSNRNGTLRVPHGYVGALAVDPVEKKPFYHALPGASALSLGMLGCDLHCGYCQNWLTSQTLRDPDALAPLREVTAAELVEQAVGSGSRIVVSTYNEPLITSEWARAVFEAAKQEDLITGYVSNGNGTPEVLDYLAPVTDLFKVDLKGFRDSSYRTLGGVLARVLDTLVDLKARGFWVEVVTLLVPGFNDSDEEIGDLTRFLADLDPLIPWHVTAFHADYKMVENPDTTSSSLLRAAEIAVASGLEYVYCGNRSGDVNQWEDTRCHGCRATVVRRVGFRVLENCLLPGGICPDCSTRIPGVWD